MPRVLHVLKGRPISIGHQGWILPRCDAARLWAMEHPAEGMVSLDIAGAGDGVSDFGRCRESKSIILRRENDNPGGDQQKQYAQRNGRAASNIPSGSCSREG